VLHPKTETQKECHTYVPFPESNPLLRKVEEIQMTLSTVLIPWVH